MMDMLGPVRSSWVVKGFSNHYRIKVLRLLELEDNLSVGEIAEKIKTDEKNASQHLAKMAIAGLVTKRYDGSTVRHSLTTRGESALKFLKSLK